MDLAFFIIWQFADNYVPQLIVPRHHTLFITEACRSLHRNRPSKVAKITLRLSCLLIYWSTLTIANHPSHLYLFSLSKNSYLLLNTDSMQMCKSVVDNSTRFKPIGIPSLVFSSDGRSTQKEKATLIPLWHNCQWPLLSFPDLDYYNKSGMGVTHLHWFLYDHPLP